MDYGWGRQDFRTVPNPEGVELNTDPDFFTTLLPSQPFILDVYLLTQQFVETFSLSHRCQVLSRNPFGAEHHLVQK